MNSLVLFILLLNLLSISSAWTAEDYHLLHQKVFGNKSKSKEIPIDVYFEQTSIGELKTLIRDEKLIHVNGLDYKNLLKNKLDVKEQEKLMLLSDGPLSPEQLPFPLTYEAINVRLLIKIPLEALTAQERLIQELSEKKSLALPPAAVAAVTNFKLEKFWAADNLGGNYTLGIFDSFINANGVVLENQTTYQSNQEHSWYRGDTRIVKDFPESMIRAQAGDLNFQTIGYQTQRQMGGISVARNFNLNPYRSPYPQATQSFVIKTRSKVNYYVNGNLMKSEYLLPGRYLVRDLPLANGLNTIVIEIEDDLHRKELLTFRQSTSINLLHHKEARFDITSGYPFLEQGKVRHYHRERGEVISSFLQYGFQENLTAATYGQHYDNFNLFGAESLWATSMGNINFGAARGQDYRYQGSAVAMGYNLVFIKAKGMGAHNVNLRYELRKDRFIQTWDSEPLRIKNLANANYSLPLNERFTVSIGGGYGQHSTTGKVDRYTYDTSLTFRVFTNANATVFAGRTRDEMNDRIDIAYCMLNMTLPEPSHFMSGYADSMNQTRRISYTKDNYNRLYNTRAQATVENNLTAEQGDLDLTLPTSMSDLGVHATSYQYKAGGQSYRYSIRTNSALSFVADKGEWSWALSRPLYNSFALFAPSENLKRERVGVQSTSPYLEGVSDFMGKTVFLNLLPYQYRQIQLDPGELSPGLVLGQESYVLYPTYRSAHLIFIGSSGKIMARGLLFFKGLPAEFKAGEVFDSKGLSHGFFFTNKNGQFLLEGLLPGDKYKMLLNDGEQGQFEIPAETKGIYSLGTIEVKE